MPTDDVTSCLMGFPIAVASVTRRRDNTVACSVQQQSADRFDMKRVLSAGDLTSVMNDDHDNGLPFTQQRSRRSKKPKKTSNVTNDAVCSTQLNPQSNSQSQSQSQSVPVSYTHLTLPTIYSV